MPDMRPEKQALIDYLMNKTGGALVMTPDELALEIRVSAKQQSKLRKEFKFPIPYQNTGRKVYYSLYAVADYLLDGVGRGVDQIWLASPPTVVASALAGQLIAFEDLRERFAIPAPKLKAGEIGEVVKRIKVAIEHYDHGARCTRVDEARLRGSCGRKNCGRQTFRETFRREICRYELFGRPLIFFPVGLPSIKRLTSMGFSFGFVRSLPAFYDAKARASARS